MVCYPNPMIRRLVVVFIMSALAIVATSLASAASYPLVDGSALEGDPISFNPGGVVVKRGDGTLAPRVAWTNFTQEALQQFAKDPKNKPFVEPYLEVEESEAEKKPSLEIKPKPHPRLERPDPKAGMGALFSSSLSVVLFLLVYAANIYAAFEIALFRNYHPGLVCGVAAVAPVLGPIVFLCLPTRVQKSHDELAAESMAQHAPEEVQLAYAHPGGYDPNSPAQAEGEAVPAAPKVTVYQRGQTTFNRRFFETKFAGFLKVVPGEEEKDKVIYIKSARGEHVGSRLTRILPNEVYLQVQKGDATADVIIPFTEIYEIQIRPKEA
jgi:hypothetical protein